MADDLSLLFKLRGDATSLKSATTESRAAVNQLRQSLGPQLTQTTSVTNAALGDLGDTLTNSVAQRLPLVGNAFVRVSGNLRGLNDELKRGGPQTEALTKQIDGIARSSGRTTTEISRFLSTFVRLEGQTARNDAAFKFFGGSVDAIGNKTGKFVPELEKAGVALAGSADEAAAAGAAVGGMALPIGIAVVALVGLGAAAVTVGRELFTLSKTAAEFQGKLFDLAQQTGVSVETLSALEIQAKKVGGELGGGLIQSIVAFQRQLEEAQDPTSKAAENFRKLGVETADTESALRQAFAALARMPEGFKQTNAAAELFGSRGGKIVLAILKESSGDLDAVIAKAREAGVLIGTDAARAADVFNDALADLDFQLRAASAAAAEELIPAFIGLLQATTDLVRASGPLLKVFGDIAGPTVRAAASALKGLGLVVALLTLDYKALAKAAKESQEATEIRPITITEQAKPTKPVQTDRQVAQEAVQAADAVVAAAKRVALARNQILSERFEEGRIDKAEQARETIADNKRVLDAEKARIDATIKLKQQEAKSLEAGSEAYRKVVEDVNKLQQQQLDAENLFTVTSRELRAKAAQERADSLRSQSANETNILLKEFDRQIAGIEAHIQRGDIVEGIGLTVIETLERAKIDARREGLEEQKRIGFLTIAEREDLNRQIQALDQDADRLQDEQRNRRLQRELDTAARVREIKLAEIDTVLELQRIVGERTIAAIQALADLRIKTEEDAAREILRVRLDLIDQEIEATEAKLTAAKSIVSTDERVRAEAELNNQLAILNEQRRTIQADGNRAIDAGRQQDLENERRYADELERLRERTEDIERDTAEEVIRLMRLHFARRRDIIRAERDLELQREDDRHRRETERINELKRQTDEEIRLLEKRLERLVIGTTEEIEEHDRIIASLERLRQARTELDRQQAAEDERNQTRQRQVTVKANVQLASPDAALRDVFDDLGESIVGLGEKFAGLVGIGKEFSAISAQLAVQIGGVLAGAFNQVADAIGQTVSNWVLLGETGPAVMRKILAQALASIAAEAAVNAIKELALGFATLFFNPAESAAHFTAAGLWAAIGGVAAVAGRAVAGDLFKPKTEGPGTGARGSGSSGGSDKRDPIDLIRNQQQTLTIIVRGEPGPGFNNAIINGVVDSVRTNGPLRTVIQREAGG